MAIAGFAIVYPEIQAQKLRRQLDTARQSRARCATSVLAACRLKPNGKKGAADHDHLVNLRASSSRIALNQSLVKATNSWTYSPGD
jgi:hypothetical protein